MSDGFRCLDSKYSRDKSGLVNVTAVWNVPTLADCDSFSPSAEEGVSLPLSPVRSAERAEDGTWQLTLTYEGIISSSESSFAATTSVEVELQGNMAQEPIKSHPNFDKLSAKYGWEKLEDGQFGFPRELPAAGDGNAHSAGSGSKAKQSPLFGVTDYLSAEGVFRARYTRRSVPAGLLDNVGTAVTKPNFFSHLGVSLPKGRNFLKLVPTIAVKGNALQITEEYRLSGPRGVNKDIYSFAQLSGTPPEAA